MKENTKKNNPNHLSFGKLLAWKSSDISQAGVQVIVMGYLTMYCTDTLGIGAALVGTLLLVSKIFDGITDIFAGWLVDNTRTKFGKGRTYELCIIGVMLCSLGLFSAKPEWSMVVKCAWIFCMYTLQFSVFTTLRGASGTPYCIRAFSNNHAVITKVASFGGLISMAGSMIISITFPIVMSKLATDASGWTRTVAIFVIPLGLIGLLRFFIVKEDPTVDEVSVQTPISVKEILTMFKKNQYVWYFAAIMLFYNLMTALGVLTYYFKWIVGNTSMISVFSAISVIVLPVMLVFPVIMKKMGTMGDMISSFAVVGIIGYGIAFFAKANIGLLVFGGILGTFATLPLAYYGVLFIMKCCTYNEMQGLPRMDGSAGILSNFTSKIGSAVGSAFTGIMLGVSGYVSGSDVLTQPDSALLMIRVLYAIVPAISLVLIAIFAKKFTKLEKVIPEWEAEQKKKLEVESA